MVYFFKYFGIYDEVVFFEIYKLDLVCDGPGVYVGAVSGFTMKWYFSKFLR